MLREEDFILEDLAGHFCDWNYSALSDRWDVWGRWLEASLCDPNIFIPAREAVWNEMVSRVLDGR